MSAADGEEGLARLAARLGIGVGIDGEGDRLGGDREVVHPLLAGRDLNFRSLCRMRDRIVQRDAAAVHGLKLQFRNDDFGTGRDGDFDFGDVVGGDRAVLVQTVSVEIVGFFGRQGEFEVFQPAGAQPVGDAVAPG